MSSCTCAVSRLHVLSYLHDALPISPTLASAIVAPLMTVFFPMENNAAGAGMGTSGFVGQIMAVETMGATVDVWISILVFHIILPAVLTLVFYILLRRMGLIKDGDQVLRLSAKD